MHSFCTFQDQNTVIEQSHTQITRAICIIILIIIIDPFYGEFGGFLRCLSYLDLFHVYYSHLHW